MRVYLPSTLTGLARALSDGELGPAPLIAHAVTPALRESYASGDTEELEYVAMSDAARRSLRMLADDPGAPSHRVVLAAEVPDVDVQCGPGDDVGGDSDGRSAVRITGPLPLSEIVSGHIDDALAEPDIRAARSAVPAADAGDDDARFIVDGAEGHELMWYATQELPYVPYFKERR